MRIILFFASKNTLQKHKTVWKLVGSFCIKNFSSSYFNSQPPNTLRQMEVFATKFDQIKNRPMQFQQEIKLLTTKNCLGFDRVFEKLTDASEFLKTDNTSNFSSDKTWDNNRTTFNRDPIQMRTVASTACRVKETSSGPQPTTYADQFKALHQVKLTKHKVQ